MGMGGQTYRSHLWNHRAPAEEEDVKIRLDHPLLLHRGQVIVQGLVLMVARPSLDRIPVGQTSSGHLPPLKKSEYYPLMDPLFLRHCHPINLVLDHFPGPQTFAHSQVVLFHPCPYPCPRTRVPRSHSLNQSHSHGTPTAGDRTIHRNNPPRLSTLPLIILDHITPHQRCYTIHHKWDPTG